MATKRRRRRSVELLPEQKHSLAIARATLKMNDVMLAVMGGPNKYQARQVIRAYGGGEAEIRRLEGKPKR